VATDRPKGTGPDPLSAYRRAAIAVFLAIDVFLIAADVLGRLFRDPSFRVDSVVFGMAFGTTLTLLGLEGLSRLFPGPK
jgi:hypothetical protein